MDWFGDGSDSYGRSLHVPQHCLINYMERESRKKETCAFALRACTNSSHYSLTIGQLLHNPVLLYWLEMSCISLKRVPQNKEEVNKSLGGNVVISQLLITAHIKCPNTYVRTYPTKQPIRACTHLNKQLTRTPRIQARWR